MSTIRAIETEYNGYKFRSRLEARWAILFDCLNLDWQYEPEGVESISGERYLPDFRIRGMRVSGWSDDIREDIWVEVKGDMMEQDARKIEAFAFPKGYAAGEKPENPVLVLGNLPRRNGMWDPEGGLKAENWRDPFGLTFSTKTLFGSGQDSLVGLVMGSWDEGALLIEDEDMYRVLCENGEDWDKTIKAYTIAGQARFEHGETPTYEQIKKQMEG